MPIAAKCPVAMLSQAENTKKHRHTIATLAREGK